MVLVSKLLSRKRASAGPEVAFWALRIDRARTEADCQTRNPSLTGCASVSAKPVIRFVAKCDENEPHGRAGGRARSDN